MRCWVFPRPDPGNPYQSLLAAAMRRRGVRMETGRKLSPLWAMTVPAADGVHIHWLEFLLVSQRGGRRLNLLFSALRSIRTLATLAVLRLRGIPVVWTVHNLAPHEPRHPKLERAGFRLAARLASAVHVHSRWAGQRVVEELGLRSERKLICAPHGNYIGAYDPPGDRSLARRRLGIPEDANAYVIFGAIRAYKRIPEALEAFGRHRDPQARLLVAGKVGDPELRARLEAAAARDRRIDLRLGFVPDEQVNLLLGAADAAILNYEEVFSSGALLAALSAGTPVVAPANGTAAEVAPPPAAELFQPGELPQALRGVLRDRPARRQAALETAKRFGWDSTAEQLVAAFASTNG